MKWEMCLGKEVCRSEADSQAVSILPSHSLSSATWPQELDSSLTSP